MSKSKLIARGRTAEVYEWREGEVLKLFFDWCPTDWPKQEAFIAHAINHKGLSAPKYIETVTVEGRNGIVYERVIGTSMLSLMSKNPLQTRRQAKVLAELHSEINSQTGETLPNLKAALGRSISKCMVLSDEMKAKALLILAELKDANSLCHFDLHPDQVLITTHGPVVLDWMTAHQGNPAADVARTLVLLQYGEAPYMNWIMRQAVNLVRSAFSRAYLKRYLELSTDVRLPEIKRWMIPVAAARLNDGIKGEERALLLYLKRLMPKYEGA